MYFGCSSDNSFMEVSNSEVFFSQEKDLNPMEFDFLVIPPFDDRRQREPDDISSSPDTNDQESTIIQENQEDDEFKFLESSTLESSKEFNNPVVQKAQESSQEFNNPVVQKAQESSREFNNPVVQKAQESSQEFKNVQIEEALEEVDDGFKTPTSSENKIPPVLKCPPAPKKPKSLPLSKRKCPARWRVLLDLSNEIESLFPPDVLKDLIGGKIKKVRKQFDGIS